jgi:hypothetical protein
MKFEESAYSEVVASNGTKEQVLLPIWRALRKFESFNATETHWPPVDYSRLAKPNTDLRGENGRQLFNLMDRQQAGSS